MALHRELQANYRDEYTLTVSAPMARPYDLSVTIQIPFIDAKPLANPYYFTLV